MTSGTNDNFLKPEEKEFQTFYKREMWWLGHRALLEKIFFALFIVFDVSLLAFAGWHFFDSFVLSGDREAAAVAVSAVVGQSELRDFSLDVAADPLSVGDAESVASGDGVSFDLYAEVSNPNDDWYASFVYAFKLKDGETAEVTGFILPNEIRPVVAFKAVRGRPAVVELVLRDIEWHRIDPRLISDYESWYSEHAVSVGDAAFIRSEDQATLPTISFSVKNSTAYNYYQPSFLAVLRRGNSVAGLVRVTTSDLVSGESKALSSRWIGVVPTVTKVEVYQEINFLATESYSALTGSASGDARTKVNTR